MSRIHILILMLIAVLSGCAGGGEKEILSSWIGSNINAVITHWGPPQQERTIAGRKYFIWSTSQSVSVPAQTSGTATVVGNTVYYNQSTVGGGSFTASCTRSMEVDENNIVVRGYSQGNNCCVLAIAGYCASLLKR